MSHGYTVIDGNGIEFGSIASHALYLGLYYLTYLVQVSMSGNKLSKRVDNSYNWFAKHLPLHAICHPQSTCACHAATLCTYSTSQLMFHML